MAQRVDCTELNEETCLLILQKLTVAELKHVLRQFGRRVGGIKSELQSRATRLLQLEGSSKVGPVILQISTVSQRIGSLPRTTNTVQSSDNTDKQQNACQCTVKFKETTFYTKIDTLVEPTPLVGEGKKSYMNFTSLKISLTANQLADIKNSQATDDDASKVFIILRFCHNVPDEPQDDYCPSCCDIGVKLHFDWYPITLSRGKLRSPVDITKLITARSSYQVIIMIRWLNNSANTKEGFVYTVDMVKGRVIEDVTKTIPTISAADSRTQIKDKLSSYTSNEELSSSSQQISFQCPLSMSRIKDPCRGINCKHLQCFDAASYLRLNRIKPSWICPVCQQSVVFSELKIDGLQLEILRHSTIVKIEFDANGCWHPLLDGDKKRVMSIDDDYCIDSPQKKKGCGEKLEIIDLTIDSPLKTNHAATGTIVL